ncbi:uncharacterized protein LOC126401907 [Epinephelus moara]|uniref:uncharacterized protein LOC126401907 n=1 Tax=Epinephelus moara TaxID=300413 RepID=UPI00214EE8CE|nr:uncharacterized protein LOC126401907 [Epinephelus moara]
MREEQTFYNLFCFKGVFFQLWLLHGFTATSLPNVARSGIASQSSTYFLSNASKAIDGNKNPDHYAGSCSHTVSGPSHWWNLLLPAVYRIASISITNRKRVAYRINNAKIRIGNSQENGGSNNPICAVIPSIPSGGTSTFDCGGMIGRYVSVTLGGHQSMLSLCEVEVYGELAAPFPSYSKEVMGKQIVVVKKKLCWSDALFYCRDFYWDLFSIRSEEEQRNVEQVLGNTTFPLTKHVWLGLRRYLMDGKWFWMSDDSVNYAYWETQSIWQLTSPCGGINTSGHFRWRDLPCGDPLYFICLAGTQAYEKRVGFWSSTRQ